MEECHVNRKAHFGVMSPWATEGHRLPSRSQQELQEAWNRFLLLAPKGNQLSNPDLSFQPPAWGDNTVQRCKSLAWWYFVRAALEKQTSLMSTWWLLFRATSIITNQVFSVRRCLKVLMTTCGPCLLAPVVNHIDLGQLTPAAGVKQTVWIYISETVKPVQVFQDKTITWTGKLCCSDCWRSSTIFFFPSHETEYSLPLCAWQSHVAHSFAYRGGLDYRRKWLRITKRERFKLLCQKCWDIKSRVWIKLWFWFQPGDYYYFCFADCKSKAQKG